MSTDTGISVEAVIPQDFPFNISLDEMKMFGFEKLLDEYINRENTFDAFTETILILGYTVFISLGILTNFVIICVIISNKKRMTSNTLLLLNLFVSDMLLCIFCMPFTLMSLIRRSWPFGAFMCKLIPFLQAVSIFVSAATITSIALDRMTQITAKRFTGKNSTNKLRNSSKYAYITLFIWIISVLLASPIAVYQEVVEYGIKGLFAYNKCVENWPNNHKSIYSLTIFIAQLLIPNLVMLVSHYRIRKYLRSNRFTRKPLNNKIYNNSNNSQNITITIDKAQREEMISSERPTISLSTTGATTCYAETVVYDCKVIDREEIRNNRITVFLLTITILFGISWLPWNVFNVLADFMGDFDLSAQYLYLILAVCHLIAMSSATTNAIFYGFLHTTIKHDITRRVKRVRNVFI